MRIFSFEAATARPLTAFGSANASIAPLARPSGFVQLVCMRLEAGGVVGMHPATIPQLFLVVTGEGWPIRAGLAAVWEAGEEHESGTEAEAGMMAIVLEAAQLDPAQVLREE